MASPHKRPQRVTLSLSKGLPQVSHARKIFRCAQDDSFGARAGPYYPGYVLNQAGLLAAFNHRHRFLDDIFVSQDQRCPLVQLLWDDVHDPLIAR